MTEDRLNRLQADLQRAPTVIYLEGKTDEELLFALAGVPRPSSSIHKNIYVVGLKARGQGSNEVRALLQEAGSSGLAGKPGSGGVFGIIDGDGRDLPQLLETSGPNFQGPLFSWPTYCIENLLAHAWPATWGNEPDWTTALSSYVPYAALNRVHLQLQEALQTLQLARFQSPLVGQPLRTVDEVKAELVRDKHLIAERDVAAMFEQESDRLHRAIQSSLDEGHALINGKWLVSHLAAQHRPGRAPDALRTEWARSMLAKGGHPAVRALWTLITGEAP